MYKTVVFYIYLDTFICLKFQSVQLDAFHVCVHAQKEKEEECLCMCTEGKGREVGERRKGCVWTVLIVGKYFVKVSNGCIGSLASTFGDA